MGAVALAVSMSVPVDAQPAPAPTREAEAVTKPWMDRTLPPDRRAELVVAAMTQDEKIQLIHGGGFSFEGTPGSNGGAGYVPGIARLGLPDLNMADSTVGVTRGALRGRYSTSMPATIAEAASWDPQIAYDYGVLIGRELRAQGYNVSLAGGVNLLREPRNGRSFEYRGEDPVLSGKLAAQWIRGLQDQHVIGDIKHYALNDQETGRQSANVVIEYAAARESDLLAFEIGVREGRPGMVMCAYNKINGDWACDSEELLTRTLKQEWGFEGFVLSDWGGTHSTEKAIMAGLDQEQPGEAYFGDKLKEAVANGRVPQARLDDAVRRIVRTMFASGIVDDPPRTQVVDVYAGFEAAQRVAESGSVLLKNDGLLPLARRGRIAVFGSHADVGVLTGGGSGQVDVPGGNAVKGQVVKPRPGVPDFFNVPPVWYPSSPLKALRAGAPEAEIVFDDGADPRRAAEIARTADVAIVFAHQPASEGSDHPSLALPDDQDALIGAVTSANPRSLVVLETGGPVSMPWADAAAAIVEVWYPGARGGKAIARLLLGDVNFTGKLPVTFPRADADLPHPVVQGSGLALVPAEGPFAVMPNGQRLMVHPPFDIHYGEGAQVGYKWFEAEGKATLFPFGHGLSYTRYAYSGLRADPGNVSFTVRNVGKRAGTEIAQVYAALPEDSRRVPRQLVGWARVELAPGESKQVTVTLEPLLLSIYDAKARRWRQPKGRYHLFVGGSSGDTPLSGGFALR